MYFTETNYNMDMTKIFTQIYESQLYETTEEEWSEDPMYIEHPEFSKLKSSQDKADQAFVAYASKMFPDSPNGCLVLRFNDESEDLDKLDELNAKLDEFLTSDNYIIAPVNNLDNIQIVDKEQLYDSISDSKNYCDFYAAHYAHSDGWNETILMSSNPAGNFAIGRFDYEMAMELAKDALYEDPKLLVDLARKMNSYGKVFAFNDNTGMEKFDY